MCDVLSADNLQTTTWPLLADYLVVQLDYHPEENREMCYNFQSIFKQQPGCNSAQSLQLSLIAVINPDHYDDDLLSIFCFEIELELRCDDDDGVLTAS